MAEPRKYSAEQGLESAKFHRQKRNRHQYRQQEPQMILHPDSQNVSEYMSGGQNNPDGYTDKDIANQKVNDKSGHINRLPFLISRRAGSGECLFQFQ